MISTKEVKKTFKIFLDSSVGASYNNGPRYNATYIIDLNTIIQTDSDYDKQYYMNVSFISTAQVTTANIDPANIYTLHVDMGKGLNIYQYRRIKVPSVFLPVDVISTNSRFLLTDEQQKPTFIQNIRNLNNITLNIINVNNNATFNPSTQIDYVCVLTFVEA